MERRTDSTFYLAFGTSPDLVIDFQDLEHLPIQTVQEATCLATLTSPFAEALSTRFRRYLGRPGTPDLDLDAILQNLARTCENQKAESTDEE